MHIVLSHGEKPIVIRSQQWQLQSNNGMRTSQRSNLQLPTATTEADCWATVSRCLPVTTAEWRTASGELRRQLQSAAAATPPASEHSTPRYVHWLLLVSLIVQLTSWGQENHCSLFLLQHSRSRIITNENVPTILWPVTTYFLLLSESCKYSTMKLQQQNQTKTCFQISVSFYPQQNGLFRTREF